MPTVTYHPEDGSAWKGACLDSPQVLNQWEDSEVYDAAELLTVSTDDSNYVSSPLSSPGNNYADPIHLVEVSPAEDPQSFLRLEILAHASIRPQDGYTARLYLYNFTEGSFTQLDSAVYYGPDVPGYGSEYAVLTGSLAYEIAEHFQSDTNTLRLAVLAQDANYQAVNLYYAAVQIKHVVGNPVRASCSLSGTMGMNAEIEGGTVPKGRIKYYAGAGRIYEIAYASEREQEDSPVRVCTEGGIDTVATGSFCHPLASPIHHWEGEYRAWLNVPRYHITWCGYHGDLANAHGCWPVYEAHGEWLEGMELSVPGYYATKGPYFNRMEAEEPDGYDPRLPAPEYRKIWGGELRWSRPPLFEGVWSVGFSVGYLDVGHNCLVRPCGEYPSACCMEKHGVEYYFDSFDCLSVGERSDPPPPEYNDEGGLIPNSPVGIYDLMRGSSYECSDDDSWPKSRNSALAVVSEYPIPYECGCCPPITVRLDGTISGLSDGILPWSLVNEEWCLKWTSDCTWLGQQVLEGPFYLMVMLLTPMPQLVGDEPVERNGWIFYAILSDGEGTTDYRYWTRIPDDPGDWTLEYACQPQGIYDGDEGSLVVDDIGEYLP